MAFIRDYLKNRILVQGQGGREVFPRCGTSRCFIPRLWVATGGILKYFEDWNRAPNVEIGPKDIFEMASKYLLTLLLLLIPAAGWCLDLTYDLKVNIDPARREFSGTGLIHSTNPAEFSLSVAGLQDVRINNRPVTPDGHQQIAVHLASGEKARITYKAVFRKNSRQRFIDREHVFLSGGWYPQPDTPVRYRLSVTLPENFVAVGASEAVSRHTRSGNTTFDFHFDNPLDGLYLAASSRFVVHTESHGGIAIETYFFKEDAALADTYIQYTKKYLDMYAAMLTPYPYRRFAIVENILPTGYSMPTFTLLGQSVVKLPFIVRTSLGHEILHQWFGNSIYIDHTQGNWAEGLTNYLADHHYAAIEGRGPAYRKQIMLNYQAYVNPDNAMPVSHFTSRRTRTEAAIGYGKAAMIFHMLRRRYGDKLFFTALRELIHSHSFQEASWQDVRRVFEKTTAANLEDFFTHWLDRRDIPALTIENAKLALDRGRLALSFTIEQDGSPYRLAVPVLVKTARSQHARVVATTASSTEVLIPLDSAPVEVIIDGEYDIMRTLQPAEHPPILADILGSDNVFVAAAARQRSVYKPLVDALGIPKAAWIDPDNVNFDRLKTATLIIAGFTNPLVNRFLGGRRTPQDGLRLEIYKNPFAPEKRLMLVQAGSMDEARAVARKLRHYGKYSTLAFQNGRNTYKTTAASNAGMAVLSQSQPLVVRPAKKETLADIIPEIRSNQVIFVGEQHDRLAHHLNQLAVIQALHTAGDEIGVGMEMFQGPYQPAIDAYLAGRIDEREFLLQSEYYDRWRYDYHLYKPIIDYLKANQIPLVALNVSGEISRQTGRQGLDSLSVEQRRQVPEHLDFTDDLYREDLKQVFNLHGSETGLDEFNHFYQAQTLWDEAMASRAAAWMKANPDRKLVVLAGNGHLRYKYGIPQRLYRRVAQPYAVIVQDEDIEPGIADYVLFTTPIEGIKSPKLGIMVTEQEGALAVKSAIEHGPAGKAGLAAGDIITALAGHPIKTLADLKIALFYTKHGDRVQVEINRGGAVLEKEVLLKARPRHISLPNK